MTKIKKSRNRKKRIERNVKMENKMSSLLNEIKTEKKKKNKNLDKFKDLEIEIFKNKYAYNANKLQSELKELNETQVIDKKLHVIKQEILGDYKDGFEIIEK